MDKLSKVLKVRAQQEQESAAQLASSQAARSQAEAQQRQLDELTAQYRQQHSEVVQGGAHRFSQFQRFYAQLTVAVNAQRDIVEKATQAEAYDEARFIERHKDRRALEELLQQRDLAHKTKRLRAQRRTLMQPPANPMV